MTKTLGQIPVGVYQFNALHLEDKKGCSTKGCTRRSIPGSDICPHCLAAHGRLKRTSVALRPAMEER